MRSAFALLILITGCDLYFSDGDDCAFATDVAPAQELRDPETGQCQPWGFPGCDDACAPCAAEVTAQPDWGACLSSCDELGETPCMDTPGCRAVYDANTDVDQPPQFLACWSIAPSGPAPGGCDGLDAYECSRHDNCVAFYDDDEDGSPLVFRGCKLEQAKGCYSDADCGAGAHCSVSDGDCGSPPGCDPQLGCPDVCYGRCVSGDVCDNVECGPGAHCESQCYPCDGVDGPCDPICQPTCVLDQDSCAAVDCGPGFECHEVCQGGGPDPSCSATCVPLGTCETLATEQACLDRGDCTAVYLGDNCTCYSNGTCDCEVLTYDRCEAK